MFNIIEHMQIPQASSSHPNPRRPQPRFSWKPYGAAGVRRAPSPPPRQAGTLTGRRAFPQAMLIRPHDAAPPDAWRGIVDAHDFGVFVLPGDGGSMPALVPSHFIRTQDDRILAHFTRDNPIWERLAESDRCALSVVAAYTYVPSAWNASSEEGTSYGVPTSYYAAVEVVGRARPLDAPAEMAALLNAMLAHFEPGSARRPVETGDNPDTRQFGAIRGLELRPESIRAKTKFGGNRSAAHRAAVEARLRERAGAQDLLAADFMAAVRGRNP